MQEVWAVVQEVQEACVVVQQAWAVEQESCVVVQEAWAVVQEACAVVHLDLAPLAAPWVVPWVIP